MGGGGLVLFRRECGIDTVLGEVVHAACPGIDGHPNKGPGDEVAPLPWTRYGGHTCLDWIIARLLDLHYMAMPAPHRHYDGGGAFGLAINRHQCSAGITGYREILMKPIDDRPAASAYDRLSELAGQGLKPALQAVMNRPSYQNGSDGDAVAVGSRSTMLQEVILRHRQQALQQTMREYPELRTKAQADHRYKSAMKHSQATQQTALDAVKNLQ